ncbi:MAG TPA: GspL/Epsl periplasmic domain-containing protein, partial [Desulfatirhabdiaceae bacterium]|nr:GspL/Epsl periplasmic domain-containing protein [Desulfatirhabdiaceae bacterium]
MSTKIIGIDIHHHGVSAVVIRMGFQKVQLEAHSYTEYSTKDGMLAGIGSCLASLSEETDIAGMPAAISLPSDDLFFRNFTIPFRRRHEIEKILPCELEPLLPVPIERLITDFQVIETHSGRSNLLSVSTPKMLIADIRTACKPFRLDIRRIMPGIFATALAHTHLSNSTKNCLIMDIDKHTLSFCIIAGSRIYLVRSVILNTEDTSFKDTAGMEIQRTLLAAEQSINNAFSLDMVYVNGSDGKPVSNLCSTLSRILNIPFQQLDYFDDKSLIRDVSSVSNRHSTPMNTALASAIVLGKAIPGINFRDRSALIWNLWYDYRFRWIELGVYTALAMILAVTTLSIDMVFKEKQLDRLDRQVTQMFYSVFPKDTPMVEPIHQLRLKIKETARNEWLQLGSGHGLLDILNGISKNTPPDMKLTIRRLTFDESRIQLVGYTPDFETV